MAARDEDGGTVKGVGHVVLPAKCHCANYGALLRTPTHSITPRSVRLRTIHSVHAGEGIGGLDPREPPSP